MSPSRHISDFLNYLADSTNHSDSGSVNDSLPPISEISADLGISVASLREQLEVAKALGFVDVKPRTGIRRLPYSFTPAVRQSLSYALATDPTYFDGFSDLRNHLEAAYWSEAVQKLTKGDRNLLKQLVSDAWQKLRGTPIQIPHDEHRQIHLLIYSRLDSVFIQGILEAYWDAYEAVGLNLFADYNYLETVWGYHEEMVEAICSGEYERGFSALVEHKDLIYHRPV